VDRKDINDYKQADWLTSDRAVSVVIHIRRIALTLEGGRFPQHTQQIEYENISATRPWGGLYELSFAEMAVSASG
jgi:hypothetical protein